MERIALMVDQMGSGENVFEQFAIEFEQSSLQGDINIFLSVIQSKIEIIENRLQDLSEKITAENEHVENKYAFTISKTKAILSIWLPVFSNRNIDPNIVNYLSAELDRLLEYVALSNIESKSLDQIKDDFKTKFIVTSDQAEELRGTIAQIQPHIFVSHGSSERITMRFVKEFVTTLSAEFIKAEEKPAIKLVHVIQSEISNIQAEIVDDGENTLYYGELKIWIDTKDPAEANRFMSVVAAVLSSIENVEIEILDAGVGSIWQKWGVTIKGWFAKEETKQILNKGIKAAEYYSMDRHIAPVEKDKMETSKMQAEIKRMMPEEQTKKLQDIEVQKSEEELKSLKLTNVKQQLEIIEKLSDLFAQGILTVDSDFRIELNGAILIMQESGKIIPGKLDEIDNNLNKKMMDVPKDDKKNKSE